MLGSGGNAPCVLLCALVYALALVSMSMSVGMSCMALLFRVKKLVFMRAVLNCLGILIVLCTLCTLARKILFMILVLIVLALDKCYAIIINTKMMIVNFNWCSIELMVGWLVGANKYDSCERKNWFGVLFFLLHVMISEIMICIHHKTEF